jgi:hypothetical protein
MILLIAPVKKFSHVLNIEGFKFRRACPLPMAGLDPEVRSSLADDTTPGIFMGGSTAPPLDSIDPTINI